MQVKEIMTKDVACCTPETGLRDVASLMVEHDCGAIPVVDDERSRRPVGVITDRDIACRTVAQGKNPLELTAGDCMTAECVTVSPDADVEDCCQVMEENQIRRVAVVDERGSCCGVVVQADIVEHVGRRETAEVVQEVSRPTEAASGSNGGVRRSGCC